MKRRWLPIVIMVLVVGLAFGAYWVFAHSAEPALSVSQLKEKADSVNGQRVLLTGKVMPGSLHWDKTNQTMHFDLGDGVERQAVVFKGVVPDKFQVGTKVTVEGQLREGYFEAQRFSNRSLCNVCH